MCAHRAKILRDHHGPWWEMRASLGHRQARTLRRHHPRDHAPMGLRTAPGADRALHAPVPRQASSTRRHGRHQHPTQPLHCDGARRAPAPGQPQHAVPAYRGVPPSSPAASFPTASSSRISSPTTSTARSVTRLRTIPTSGPSSRRYTGGATRSPWPDSRSGPRRRRSLTWRNGQHGTREINLERGEVGLG